MPVRVARENGERLDAALDALLPVEPHLAYANFPAVARREGAVLGLHRGRFRRAAAGLGVLVARDDAGRPLAALPLGHRAFESAHFDMAMARADPPAAVPDADARLGALRVLYAEAIDELRRRGYVHLSCMVSTHDRIGCWVAQEHGAFHVGSKITWMAPLDGRPAPDTIAGGLRLELHDAATIPTLARSAWQPLVDYAGEGFDRGPMVFDLNVPYARAAGIYQEWTEKAMTGEWADTLLVVRDGDRIVAFNSMKWLPDVSEAAGVGVLGEGIGATLPGYRGLFTALQRACASWRPLGAGYLENETQASTVPTINVFGKLGHHCIRSVASFHARLDRPPPR
jgi:hypothetical protein